MNKILLLFLIVSFLTSCVAFQKNNLKKDDVITFNIDSKKKLKVYAKWNFHFEPVQYSELTYEGRKDIFRKVVGKSDCCVLVEKKKDADLIIEGQAYNKRDSARFIGWMISTVTLYVIPSWHEAQTFLSAKVRNNTETKNYNITGDSIITALWLPFIVVSPMFIEKLNDSEKQTMENLYKALFVQMKNDGLIGTN